MDEEIKSLLKTLIAEQQKTNKLLKGIKSDIGKTNKFIDEGLNGLEYLCESQNQEREIVEALFSREIIRDYYEDYLDKCEENGTEPISFNDYYNLITQTEKEINSDGASSVDGEDDETAEMNPNTTIVTSSDGKYN